MKNKAEKAPRVGMVDTMGTIMPLYDRAFSSVRGSLNRFATPSDKKGNVIMPWAVENPRMTPLLAAESISLYPNGVRLYTTRGKTSNIKISDMTIVDINKT